MEALLLPLSILLLLLAIRHRIETDNSAGFIAGLRIARLADQFGVIFVVQLALPAAVAEESDQPGNIKGAQESGADADGQVVGFAQPGALVPPGFARVQSLIRGDPGSGKNRLKEP